MTCRHVRQLHHAYVDGELSSSLTAEVHAHLLQCPECQRQVEITRACGSVISKDKSEPEIDSGFASRVVAELQRSAPDTAPALETKRARRHRLWRVVANFSVPAAAALLFFTVLIWPTGEAEEAPDDVRVTLVANEAIEGPANAVENARRATDSLNTLLEISMDEARQDVVAGLRSVKSSNPTLLDVLLEPFTGLLEPAEAETTQSDEDQEVVRF